MCEDKKKNNELIESMNRTLNITRYTRINAYKRCKEWNEFFNLIGFIYNLLLIIVSIIMLIYTGEENVKLVISIMLVILSIITFSLDLFIATQDFSSRAEQYKISYNFIEGLLNELKFVDENDTTRIKNISKKYEDHIRSSINHEEIDYYRLNFEYPNEYLEPYKEITKIKKSNYSKLLVRKFLIKTVLTLFLYPFFCLISWILKKIKLDK